MALNIPLHESLLISILKDLFSDNNIGPWLGFKGGTAAKLFYDLDRFSVDLDFDLLSLDKADEVFEGVQSILSKYGVIKIAAKKRFTLLFLVECTDKSGEKDNVKIEINVRNFDSKYEVKPYLGVSMKVIVEEDMLAHKLVAMYERIGKTSRDIYDVRFFLNKNWPINEETIINRTGLSMEGFVIKCIERLENEENKNILFGLGELLTESQKDSCRAKLKSDTLFLLKLLLKNIQEGNFK